MLDQNLRSRNRHISTKTLIVVVPEKDIFHWSDEFSFICLYLIVDRLRLPPSGLVFIEMSSPMLFVLCIGNSFARYDNYFRTTEILFRWNKYEFNWCRVANKWWIVREFCDSLETKWRSFRLRWQSGIHLLWCSIAFCWWIRISCDAADWHSSLVFDGVALVNYDVAFLTCIDKVAFPCGTSMWKFFDTSLWHSQLHFCVALVCGMSVALMCTSYVHLCALKFLYVHICTYMHLYALIST